MLKITHTHYGRDFNEGDDYVKMIFPNKDGQMREQNMFTEGGLYNIIFKSRTAIGQKFRKFVTTLLRDLRKSGQLALEQSFIEFKKSTEIIIEKNSGSDLYLMSCNNIYKIGRSSNVVSRLGNLQTGNSEKIEVVCHWPDRGQHEQDVHERATLWFKRTRGEWFTPNTQSVGQLMIWIESL